MCWFMSKVIVGSKSKQHLNPGYVFAPYILKETIPILVDSNFSPFSKISSRYGVVETIPQKRCRKIKSILKNVNK